MKPLKDCRLYTFVDTAYLHGRAPAEVARELCDGGSDIIQLRAKKETRDQVLAMAEAILPITRQAGVPLVINDHPEIAASVGAELCHLGQEDFFDAGFQMAADVVTSLPCGQNGGVKPSFCLGLSTHAPAQAQRAVKAQPAYIAIGPVYPTGTKPTAKPVTLEYVRWAAANVTIPWFAIGGINLTTLPDVLEAGATRICVVSAILNRPDIAQACREFRAVLPQ